MKRVAPLATVARLPATKKPMPLSRPRVWVLAAGGQVWWIGSSRWRSSRGSGVGGALRGGKGVGKGSLTSFGTSIHAEYDGVVELWVADAVLFVWPDLQRSWFIFVLGFSAHEMSIVVKSNFAFFRAFQSETWLVRGTE